MIVTNDALNVALKVENNVISFTVNNSFTKISKHHPHKVAITKWLLKEFKTLKTKYNVLSCGVWMKDGYAEERAAAYIKLGFVRTKFGLIWAKTPAYLQEELDLREKNAGKSEAVARTQEHIDEDEEHDRLYRLRAPRVRVHVELLDNLDNLEL